MKKILLRSKKGIHESTIVSDEDYEYLNQFKWYKNTGGYVNRGVKASIKNNIEKSFKALLHREVLYRKYPNIDSNELECDHINRNRLDNRRENLRWVTKSQNCANRSNRNNYKYRGVFKHKKGWGAMVRKNDIVYRKKFVNEIDAARWYNEKAKEVHGEYAFINKL